MKELIDITQAFRDSPGYRQSLSNNENQIHQLESVVKGLMKSVKGTIDLSGDMSTKQLQFCHDLNNMCHLESDDQTVDLSIKSFISSMYEVEKARKIMAQQMQLIFVDQSDTFVKRDIHGVKESKKQFEQMSDKVDSALEKYLSKRPFDPSQKLITIQKGDQAQATAMANSQNQLEMAAEEVAHVRYDFHQKSIQHAEELNAFQKLKRVEYLETLLAFIQLQSSFYHQCYEFMHELDPTIQEFSKYLNSVRLQHQEYQVSIKDVREQELKNAVPYYNPLTRPVYPSKIKQIPVATKAGYLIKKGSGKITQVWSRRWFVVRNGYFVYTTRGKDEPATLAAALKLCTVKLVEVPERRFCFELISPMKSYVLQAENEKDLKDWMEVIQNAIGLALNSDDSADHLLRNMHSKEKLDDDFFDLEKDQIPEVNREMAEQIKSIPGNSCCADCGNDQAEWSSINLGILLCIECSGIHRSLGVQVSKVRSLLLDKWEQESYDMMIMLGNQKVNEIYEALYSPDTSSVKKATVKSDRLEKEKWIAAKYVNKKFVNQAPIAELQQSLWEAFDLKDIGRLLSCIAQGCPVDSRNSSGQTILLAAIERNDQLMKHFALVWNADIKVVDRDNNSTLHYAIMSGDQKFVQYLLKRRIDCNIKNAGGKLAIDLALEKGDPQLVTMIRLHQFELEESLPAKKAPQRDTMIGLPPSVSTTANSELTHRASSTDLNAPDRQLPDPGMNPDYDQHGSSSANGQHHNYSSSNAGGAVSGDERSVNQDDKSLSAKFNRLSPTKAAKNLFNTFRSQSPTRMKSGSQGHLDKHSSYYAPADSDERQNMMTGGSQTQGSEMS
ncbi:hypothetical protein MP228_002194 [Amoeboaphelidium protococcarum]|nr:hypothetical protein MP228_002194 [Amoeboaphelidium protococcarum]